MTLTARGEEAVIPKSEVGASKGKTCDETCDESVDLSVGAIGESRRSNAMATSANNVPDFARDASSDCSITDWEFELGKGGA